MRTALTRLKGAIVAASAVAVSTGWAHARTEGTLTLEEAVQLALERNPQIRVAQEEVAKARAGVREAWGVFMPSLDATAVVSHSWEIQKSAIPNFLKPMLQPLIPTIPELADMPDFVEMSFGMENVANYGASLRQPLFLGGGGIAGIRLARAAKDASEYQLEALRQQLIYRTTLAFFGCLVAKELARVEEEALAQAEANLSVVAARYEAGSASGFDRMRAEVEVANLRPEVIARRNECESALTALKTIVGLPPGARVRLEGELAFVPDEAHERPLLELQAIASKNRPELKAVQAQRTMASNAIAVARSAFLPKVFFSTDYSRQAMRNDWDFCAGDFSTGLSSAIAVQLPLFDGLRTLCALQKARLDSRIVTYWERQLRDAIASEVETARNDLRVALEKYSAAQQTVALAQEALRLATLMYDEGAGTQLDVLGSQLALRRAELNHVSALFDYQTARYRLRLAIGTLEGVL